MLYQVKRVIVGQDPLLERMVVALWARGHLLVEGVPGLAKTMADLHDISTDDDLVAALVRVVESRRRRRR